jgi:molybdate transport system substrate-binding protein
MLRAVPAAVLGGVLLLSACAAGGAQERREVRVAAAADLTFALEEIVGDFEAGHPETDVAVTYGSSGTFVQQIANGAPFDLYLSADLGYVEQLVEAEAAAEEEVFTYAEGRLVIWAPDDSPADPEEGLEGLASPEVGSVALANPEHAPYGRAAVAALESAGVYDEVEGKLVLGENIAQAAEFAQSGNAEVGVIALSLAVTEELSGSGSHAAVPPDAHPPLVQGGAVVTDAAQPQAARELAEYLTGPAGREVLERYGFGLPEGEG